MIARTGRTFDVVKSRETKNRWFGLTEEESLIVGFIFLREDTYMGTIISVVSIINGITTIVLALVPLGVVFGIVFGQIDFFSNIVTNLTDIVKMFATEGLIGLIATAIVIWLFYLAGTFAKSSS